MGRACEGRGGDVAVVVGGVRGRLGVYWSTEFILGSCDLEVSANARVLSVTARTDGSESSLPEVEIEILDADEVCDCETLTLFTDAPEPTSSSEPFDVEP